MSMDSISQGSSPRMGAMSEDQMSIRSCEEFCSRIKLMCSYGGKIMPRPHDNQLRYIGGESRILVVNRNISFADLMAKLSKISGKEIAIKYQLPNEDLDALVSVLGEDDLESMIEEYDRLEARDSSSRLRLFLFPANMKEQAQPQQNLMDFHEDNRNAEQRFVDAINGLNLGRNVEPARAIHQPVSSQLPDFLFGFEAREIRSPVQEESPSQAQFTQQPWQEAVGPLITLQSSSPLQAPASPPVSLKQQSPVGSLMTLQSSSSPPLPPQKPASPPVSVKQQTTVGSLMTLQSSSPPLPPQIPQPAFASPPASLKQQIPVLKPPISPSEDVGIIGQSVEEHPPQPEIPFSPPQAKIPSTPDEDKVGLPDLVLEIGQTESKQGEALHTTDPKDVDGKNPFLDVRSKVELSNQDLQVTPDPSLQREIEILEKQPVKSPDKAQEISYEIKGEKQQESPGTNKEFQESPKKVLPKSPPLPPQHQERLVVLDALPTLPPSQQQERLITYDQLPQQQQQQQQQQQLLQQERVVAYDQQQQHQQLVQQTERQLFDPDAPTPFFQQEPFSGIPRKVVLDPSLLPQHQQQAILQQAGPYQQVYANAIYWQAEDDSQHPQLQYESGLRSGNVILQRVVPSQVPAASIQRLSSAPQMRVVQGVANNANLNRQFSAGYVDAYQQQMQMQQQQIQMQMQMQMQQQQQLQQSPPVVQQQQQQSPPAVQPPLPQGKFPYVQQNTKNLHSFQPSRRLSPVKIQDQIGAERVIARPPASGTRAQQQPIAVDPANDLTAYEPSAPQLHFIDKAPLAPQYVSSTPFPDLFKDAGIHHVYQELPVSVEEGQARRLAVHQVARGS